MSANRDPAQQLAKAVRRLRVLALAVAQLAETLETLARVTRERAILASEHTQKRNEKDGQR